MTTAPDGGGLTEAEREALAEKFRRAAERCCQCTDGHHDWIPDYPYGTDGDVRMTRDLAREVVALLAARSTAPDIAAALEDDARPWQPGDADTRCQDCGHRYEPWFTDNWLWNTVMGGGPCDGDPGGYLCPRCFARRADCHHPHLVWRFIPEWTGKAPLMDFPAADVGRARAAAIREGSDT